MNQQAQRDISKKLKVLNYAKEIGNVAKTCRYFGICRQTFHTWKKSYEKYGEKGLIDSRPCPENHKLRTPKTIEEKILYLRKHYHFGATVIVWHLKRYHDIKISRNGCYQVLLRNGLNRLPENIKKRSRTKFKRYEKKVPGHHVQIDVKFLFFNDSDGKRIKRFQYTAIDDCTRIRALKVYEKHNQQSSIDFLNHVVDKLPFRIKMIRTDNGHEFQSKFHWHADDLGLIHAYIKPGTPRLNGKVERSHLTDKKEFYQLLDYTDDVDLKKRLNQWEDYYNFIRPHSAHQGKTPYEMLKQRI
ncbi:IS481 family transposase [Hydrogenovibrio crunogenus]|uniref:IS481 family transposase n=1 Tax=Hydrogenovibrio crunogenus TaxID=39765 RepID=A0A4P7P422_9GAMM|nr:IS481 family transposase [Hydrogenovibrio crunogenus]QBZ84152.1 IS481 family transposase [Hydrogenovibrio crunogenus]